MTLQLDLEALPDSKYAAQLRKSPAPVRFPRELEREFVRDGLQMQRPVVRFACLLVLLLLLLRCAQLAAMGAFFIDPVRALMLAIIGLCSLPLVGVAFSSLYERLYLRLAYWLVPLRGVLVAYTAVRLTAGGAPAVMMLLPLLMMGPLVLLGLPFRAGLLCAVAAFVSAFGTALTLHLPQGVLVSGTVLLLMTLAGCAVAVRLIERHARLEFLERHLLGELARQDALTWTSNRLVFDQALTRLWREAKSAARPLAILMLDVDDFKAYNDRYGHQAGDAALRSVARAVQGCMPRAIDLLARYGGEEFGVILVEVDRTQAAAIAEAMRCAVQALALEHDNSRCGPVLTVSIGVAVLQPSASRNCHGALQLADEALYRAKSAGRNRVEIMDDVEHRLLVTGEFSKDISAQLRGATPGP
jgi:diguanylate cyclase (GGDEF)-like protein